MFEEQADSGNHDLTPATPAEEDNSEVNSPIDEMLEGAPPELRQQFKMMMMGFGGMMPNPVVSKFNEDHIHKILDNTEAESIREDRQTHYQRMATIALYISSLLAVIAILIFLVLQDQAGLLAQILGGIALFGGGFGSGFGFGKRAR